MELSLTLPLVLMLLSAMMGMATALTFRAHAMIPVSLSIAVAAALVIRSHEYGLVSGVSLIGACLVAAQLAFALVIFLACRRDFLLQNEVDGAPGERREQKIHSNDE
jgi:hypothetical protein